MDRASQHDSGPTLALGSLLAGSNQLAGVALVLLVIARLKSRNVAEA